MKWVIRITIGSADTLIILSNIFRPDFYFLKNFSTKIVVVPNVLTHTIPTPTTLTSEGTTTPLCLDSKQPHQLRILYLSNLIETKGYLVLLDAINILVNQHNIPLTAHFCGEFVLAGSAPSYLTSAEAEADFFSRIKRYGLIEHVVFRGPVSGDEKHRELLEGDIFVLPTTYRNEAQPVAIIEALAYGYTVISTPHRAIPEMLDYGKAGILVEPNRPDLIADQILKIHSEPGLLSEYRRRARQQYQRCFRPDIHWDNMRKVLDV
jgi:glycosyltransferase involved in cell wall biosynthesis